MTDSLRILFTVHGYKPAYRIGGPIISVASIAETLVKRGHQVTVFTSNSNLDQVLDVPLNQPVIVNGVEVWYFEQRDIFKEYLPFIPYFSNSVGYLYLPLLKQVLQPRICEFDLIHTQMSFGYPTQVIANMGIKHSIPLFYQQRGAFLPATLRFRYLKKRIYISLIERSIMKRATFLIALTNEEVQSYRNLGVNTPCRIIPNGVAVNEYLQHAEAELVIDDQFTIRQNDFVILFLGRLHASKGADFLLDVFLKIFREYPDMRLVLAGPDQHGFKERLMLRLRSSEASKHVYMPGMVTGEVKKKLLARADLFCQPSMSEGFSIAVLEAMASATPVLVTPECNFPEIEKAAAGWVVERNEQKWAAAILEILKTRSQLSSRGRNAYQFVSSDYSWEEVVSKLESAYREGLYATSVKL